MLEGMVVNFLVTEDGIKSVEGLALLRLLYRALKPRDGVVKGAEGDRTAGVGVGGLRILLSAPSSDTVAHVLNSANVLLCIGCVAGGSASVEDVKCAGHVVLRTSTTKGSLELRPQAQKRTYVGALVELTASEDAGKKTALPSSGAGLRKDPHKECERALGACLGLGVLLVAKKETLLLTERLTVLLQPLTWSPNAVTLQGIACKLPCFSTARPELTRFPLGQSAWLQDRCRFAITNLIMHTVHIQ